jgi:hypothetical protein
MALYKSDYYYNYYFTHLFMLMRILMRESREIHFKYPVHLRVAIVTTAPGWWHTSCALFSRKKFHERSKLLKHSARIQVTSATGGEYKYRRRLRAKRTEIILPI